MADITLSPAGRFVEELSAHALALDGTPYSTARAKGTTPAGNVLVSDDQPEGVLVLASGHAFAEALPPSQSKLSKGSEVGGSFTFGGTSAGSRPVDGKAVARWRVGVGDHLRIGGGVFGAAPGSGRLYAASKCEWIFYPADPLGNGSPPLGPDGRNPLIRFLRERRYIEDLGVVLRLRRLPLLSRVDFDAVRFLLTFFEVVRYKPGDPVLAALDPVRPISVLDGRIGGPSGSYGPGSFLFADQLSPNPSPGPPPPAGAEYLALDRTVTLEIRDPLVPLLQDHDPRIGAAWDARWERPWQAIIGDVGEAAPDAQTASGGFPHPPQPARL